MRSIAFVVTVAAGLLTARALVRPLPLQIMATMASMGLLQGLFLPLLGDRPRLVLIDLLRFLAEGLVLGLLIFGLDLLCARFLAPVENAYLVGFVWPAVTYWPRGKGGRL